MKLSLSKLLRVAGRVVVALPLIRSAIDQILRPAAPVKDGKTDLPATADSGEQGKTATSGSPPDGS